MMRDEVKQALEQFQLGTRHEHWHGKTYQQFWDWFNAREEAVKALAVDDAEAAEIKDAVFDILADADDAGYAVEPEMADRMIEHPE